MLLKNHVALVNTQKGVNLQGTEVGPVIHWWHKFLDLTSSAAVQSTKPFEEGKPGWQSAYSTADVDWAWEKLNDCLP
jgi:hypothetical protein